MWHLYSISSKLQMAKINSEKMGLDLLSKVNVAPKMQYIECTKKVLSFCVGFFLIFSLYLFFSIYLQKVANIQRMYLIGIFHTQRYLLKILSKYGVVPADTE